MKLSSHNFLPISLKMATCIGIKRSDGEVCGLKCKADKLYCGRHDGRRANSRKQMDRLKKEKLFSTLAKKVNYRPTDEEMYERTYASVTHQNAKKHMKEHVMKGLHKAVQFYKLGDKNVTPLLKRSKCKFSRNVWMIISWHLSTSPRDLESLAMSCKILYHLCVKDKLGYFYHPLKHKLLSPRMLTFPIFKVKEFVLPKNFDVMLAESDLPDVKSVLAEYELTMGVPTSPHDLAKRTAEVITELCVTMLQSSSDPDDADDVDPEDFFSVPKEAGRIQFHNLDLKLKLHKTKANMYIIVSSSDLKRFEVEHKLNRALVNFTGKSLLRLTATNTITL